MDTVILIIPKGQYRIRDLQKFKPYFYPITSQDQFERMRFLEENKGLKKYIQNPKASLRDQGLVYPNLCIEERINDDIYACDLKISFSCPKVLWGHSFKEVTDSVFQTLIETLQRRLEDMGVEISLENLKNATVHTLNVSANIMFDSMEEARMFLSRLSRVSLKSWFENNTKIFANGGNTVRFRTNIFEIVFYLKYFDILESGSRSAGRKITRQEKEIAKRLHKDGIVPPVVRLEIRCNGTRSVGEHLRSALGIDKEIWTFEEVFNFLRCRKILQYYWNQIIKDEVNKTYLCEVSDEDICQKVLSEFPYEKVKNIAEALGLFYLVKSIGPKATKHIVTLRHHRKTWWEKRKKIIDFINRFVNKDESLIKLVTRVLAGNKPEQLELPIDE